MAPDGFFAWFAIGVLGVWRVTHLLAAEDGPWDLVAKFREQAGQGFTGRLLDCFKCLSLWIAVPGAAAIAEGWAEGVLLWLALSGGAILLERATAMTQHPPAVAYVEGESSADEVDDAVLRR